MKVKCIHNKNNPELRAILGDRSEDFSLIEGKEYIVYAIKELHSHIWYCIFDEDSISCPRWNPYPLFEITDPRLSRYWVFAFDQSESKKTPVISFSEWTQDPYFYTHLFEATSSQDPTVLLFNTYKELMDLEFPDPSITLTAKTGDKDWLICPHCIDAWQSSSTHNAMVRCPNCKNIQHNPRCAEV